MEVRSIVRAIYDFSSEEDDELPLQVGDIVQVIERVDRQWSRGKNDRKEGSFPLNYTIELKIPSYKENQQLFAAKFDFSAQEYDDLSFKKGDLVLGIRPIDDNWWEGELNGKRGNFPLTHVWKIDHSLLPKATGPKRVNLKARVKMNMKAQLKEEMDLLKDEIVFISEEVDKGWYRGQCNNRSGIFPASFVTVINEENEDVVNSTFNELLNLSNGNTSSNTGASVISNDQYGYDCVNSGIAAYGRTIYPFHSEYPNELSFEEGEIVNLIRYVDEKWMEGEIDGRTGMFPKDFVNIIVDCPGAISNNNNASQSSDEEMFPPDTYGRVLFNFSQSDGEAKLSEGDTVTLIKKVDANLCEVLTDNGETCICPSTCIEIIGSGPDVLPPSYFEVMKNNSFYMSTSSTDNSKSNFSNSSGRSDRPVSYPSSSFDQSSLSNYSVNRSFSSVEGKLAENLVSVDTSGTSASSTSPALHGRSYSLSSGSSFSPLDRSSELHGRMTSSPLPTLTAGVNGCLSPFDSWNESGSSYANVSNNEYSNAWTTSSGRAEPPRRPPSPLRGNRSQTAPTPSLTRQLNAMSPESSNSSIMQQLSEKEEELQRLSSCKSKLESQLRSGPAENNFVNSELQQQIVQMEAEIHSISEEISELRGNASSVSQDSSIHSNDDSASRDAEVARKRESEEKRRAEDRKKKTAEQRSLVITEILQTERDYLSDLKILNDVFLRDPSQAKAKGVDVDTLFGNLDEVIEVATRLLRRLEKSSRGESANQMIGQCFVDMADEMKEAYGHYCRNHDDVNAVLDKYGEKSPAGLFLKHKVEALKRQTNCFDLPSMLIKPVQRILKYPLLLNELVKCTDDSHPDKQSLIHAIGLMTDVATAINEFKRRKDLVFKYRKHSDTSLSGSISKLSLHSMLKKSSRFGMRISNAIGLTSVTKDENFSKVERQFHTLEKSIKIFMKDVNAYLEKNEELVKTGFQMAEDIAVLYEERKSQPEVDQFRSVHRVIVSQFWESFKQNIERNVLATLKQLLGMYHGPNNLIQKRDDKLLDYEACSNKLEKNKDATKLKMLQDNLQMTKNTYEALNSQLLDDLPKLYSASVEILRDCIQCFLKAKLNFIGRTAREMLGLKELSLLLGSQGAGVLETFQVKHTIVTDNLRQMAIVPKQLFPSTHPGNLKRNSSPRVSNLSLGVSIQVKAKSPQTNNHIILLKSTYPVSELYRVNQDYTAADLLDLSLKKSDLVGVVKQKDPMGGNLKWFVDNGVAKGFVPAKFLTKFSSEATDSGNSRSLPPAYQTQRSTIGKTNQMSTQPPLYSSTLPRSSQGKNTKVGSGHTLPGTIRSHSSEPKPNAIVPVRPAPPVNHNVLRPSRSNVQGNMQSQTNIHPSSDNNQSVPNNLLVTGNLTNDVETHRYEEIDEFTTDGNRYDLISPDEPLVSSGAMSTGATVAEFDPYSPVSKVNQLYDNVPSGATSPLYESHRYEVIPDENVVDDEYYFALYDFATMGPNQMKLSKGQVLLVLKKCDLNSNKEWWLVEDRHGNKGYVPGNYLQPYNSAAAVSS